MLIFIDEEPDKVLRIREIFFKLRIHSLCLPPSEIPQIIKYPAFAVLIARPDSLSNLEDVCDGIRKRCPHLPLVLLYRQNEGNYYTYLQLCDLVVDAKAAQNMDFIDKILVIYRQRNADSPYNCMKGEVRTMMKRKYVTVYCEKVYLTPSEWRVLRYLHLSHPRYIPAKELLDTCFSYRRQPKIGNVSTRVSTINKKIRLRFGFEPIRHRRGQGYHINRPWIKDDP